MIIIVIVLNLLITLFNVYLAIKIWQFCKLLGLITTTIINCENYLQAVLSIAPRLLQYQQSNIYLFRQQYLLLAVQLQKVKQITVLVNWCYRFWRRYTAIA